jgi:hypothetical protein
MKQKQTLNATKPLLNIKRQGGWTFWSLAFTLSVLAFFSYVGMQLVPIYTANGNIENAMERSVDGVNLRTVGRAEIIKKMDKQLYLDGSHKLLNYKEDLVITRSRSIFTLQVSYERRVPIVGNLSILAEFNPEVECSFTGQCLLK